MQRRKMSIPVSRTVSDSILTNKHDIKEQYQIDSIPIVDSKNLKYIEEIAGNQLRVLKDYPVGNDFCLNMIDRAKKVEKKSGQVTIVDYSDDYYKVNVSEKVFANYFAKCGNNDIRHNLLVQLRKDLSTGIVKIYGEDNKGRYIVTKAPFKINEIKRHFADNSVCIQILLLKDIYGSLINDNSLKNGGEGYVRIPSHLFPLCTQTEKGSLQSFNPIYKLQIFGLTKNTHKRDKIETPHEEFLRYIVPEYIDRDGYLKKMTIRDFNNSLTSQAKTLVEKSPRELLVKSFFLGRHGGNSTLYFRTGK
jgi:hypothetical protein